MAFSTLIPKAMESLTGQLLICSEPGRVELQPGSVHWEDGVIQEIQIGSISHEADFGDEQTLISPGWIDTHLHLPQFDVIGAHGMPLLKWLQEIIFPTEIRWNEVSFATEMIDRVIQQCMAVGTTGVAAYATSHHASTMQALQAFHAFGMHAIIGQVLMDRDAPPSLCQTTNQLVDEAARTLEAFPPGRRVQAAVTPRFALACSGDLLSQAGQLARDTNAYIQTHLAETFAECERVAELFQGCSYTEVYDQAGLLNERSVLGHGIHLSRDEHALLSDRRAIIAHCPTANSFLQSGVMNREQLQRDEVRITLGSDIGAGYRCSMIGVAQAMIEAATQIAVNQKAGSGWGRIDSKSELPTASDAWHQITAGNADALGWDQVGRIRVGAQADLLIIRPNIPWTDGPVEPLSRVLFSWDDRWLQATLLGGKVRWQSQEISSPSGQRR